jgi:glucose-6-phosphate isomerase
MSRVRIDLEGAFEAACGRAAGLERDSFERLVRVLGDPVQLEALRGRSGFLEVDRRGAEWLKEVRYLHAGLPAHEAVLLLGIGGSSLGARAAISAVGGGPSASVRVVDNADSDTLSRALANLDPARTIVNVVSKSGATLESLACFQVALGWMRQALSDDDVQRRIVATTDPVQGPLRAWASNEHWPRLDVPTDIGGRYSVLTPVGLFPALAAGIDIAGLLEGARLAMVPDRLKEAARLAAALHLLDTARRRAIQVWWAYGDRLQDLNAWLMQLQSESLGKRDSQGNRVGPTPVPARGASDQHSQLQLHMDGRDDKAFVFLSCDQLGPPLPLPSLERAPADLPIGAGRDLREVLEASRVATQRSLIEAGRPCISIRLDACDAPAVGELLQTLMVATAFAGIAYGVDPFDQPGVEAGKRHARALLGGDPE